MNCVHVFLFQRVLRLIFSLLFFYWLCETEEDKIVSECNVTSLISQTMATLDPVETVIESLLLVTLVLLSLSFKSMCICVCVQAHLCLWCA